MLGVTSFFVAQPFRAAEKPPNVGWAIGFGLLFHLVTIALFRGAEAPRLRKMSGALSIHQESPFSDKLLGACPRTPQTVTPA